MPRSLIRLFLLLVLCWASALATRAEPVEFVFAPPSAPGNPFARELWADVKEPDGTVLRLPAFYVGAGSWAVRARRTQTGPFRLGAVSETTPAGVVERAVRLQGPAEVTVETPAALRPIRIDPRAPRHFITEGGEPFYPLGANFAWASPGTSPDEYYPGTLRAAREAGMNWARIWMAHWGQLNLDWLPPSHGPSPAPGYISSAVAARWDRLINAAEAEGVRLQIVLQHHGQYSTRVNSNWDENPWNTTNGGFLPTPVDFFTSERARANTRHKYRYIVARWGYSPAVFAWELFNEVKWTDARAGGDESNTAVANWHGEMARHLRRHDAYGHLVTTSDDSLPHPLYAAMDFLQPHLYAYNMLEGVRRFDVDPDGLDRPIFYGEVGDDNMDFLPATLRDHGYSNFPIAWAGLMGSSPYAAQLWYVQRLLDQDRLGEFAALSRYVMASGLHRRPDLAAFSPPVSSDVAIPHVLSPGGHWHRQPSPTLHVPFDGSTPADLGELPRALVWSETALLEREPFPWEATLILDYPRDTTARLRFAGSGPRGASVRVLLDGKEVAEHRWPPRAGAAPGAGADPVEFEISMLSGRRTLTFSNPGGPQWIEFASFDTGMTWPALAAAGRRSDDLILLWIYHREGVFSEAELPPATATVHLDSVPAGTWKLTWWDVTRGGVTTSTTLQHPGGRLDVLTPPISRHGAAWLELWPETAKSLPSH